jgi:hypothetical protein
LEEEARKLQEEEDEKVRKLAAEKKFAEWESEVRWRLQVERH